MSALNSAHQVGQLIYSIEQQINACYVSGVDYSQLVVAKEALMQHLVTLKQSLDYAMESYGYYGIVPDLEDLRGLVAEVGYDQARQVYGDELDEVWAASAGGSDGFV